MSNHSNNVSIITAVDITLSNEDAKDVRDHEIRLGEEGIDIEIIEKEHKTTNHDRNVAYYLQHLDEGLRVEPATPLMPDGTFEDIQSYRAWRSRYDSGGKIFQYGFNTLLATHQAWRGRVDQLVPKPILESRLSSQPPASHLAIASLSSLLQRQVQDNTPENVFMGNPTPTQWPMDHP